MLLRNVEPFVRQVVTAKINARTEYYAFFRLKACDSRLFYILGGEGDMIIDCQSYKLSRGTVVAFRPGVEYSWRPEADSYIEYIAINYDMTNEYSHLGKSYSPIHSESFSAEKALLTPIIEDADELNYPLVLQNSAFSEPDFRAITMEFSVGGELTSLLLSSMLKSLLIGMVRESRQRREGGTVEGINLASKIVKHLQKNYMERIDYEALGKTFHMNPIYLNRIFKKYLKLSIHEYILNYRISVAMEMLKSSSASVNEIALSVGFNDIPHFSKSFKRITGYSPKDYRKNI